MAGIVWPGGSDDEEAILPLGLFDPLSDDDDVVFPAAGDDADVVLPADGDGGAADIEDNAAPARKRGNY